MSLKFLRKTLLSLLFISSAWAAPSSEETKAIPLSSSEAEIAVSPQEFALDLYFDLDDTLVYQRVGTDPLPPSSYIPVHGCIETLEYLARQDDIRLNFFSAGAHERNEPLVADLISKVEERIQRKVEYRLYSRRDMAGRKKDLTAIGANLRNSILIDDNPTAVHHDQGPNWVRIYPGHLSLQQGPKQALGEVLSFLSVSYYPNAEGAKSFIDDVNLLFDSTVQIELDEIGLPTRGLKTQIGFQRKMEPLIRNSLLRALGTIITTKHALARTSTNDVRPYINQAARLQIKEASQTIFTRTGLKAIRELYPDFDLWKTPRRVISPFKEIETKKPAEQTEAAVASSSTPVEKPKLHEPKRPIGI